MKKQIQYIIQEQRIFRSLIKEAIDDKVLEKIQKLYMGKRYSVDMKLNGKVATLHWKIVNMERRGALLIIQTDTSSDYYWNRKIKKEIEKYFNIPAHRIIVENISNYYFFK